MYQSPLAGCFEQRPDKSRPFLWGKKRVVFTSIAVVKNFGLASSLRSKSSSGDGNLARFAAASAFTKRSREPVVRARRKEKVGRE